MPVTRDGRHLESEVCVARGSQENPLSDAEILEKFRALAVPVLGHRVITNFAAESQGMTSKKVVERLIAEMRED